MAMLKRLGCEVSDLGIVSDDRASLADGLKKVAGTHDLILTTGGVSTGEEDHVKAERRKRRHAGAVADGDQARPSGRDGNYRRHAVHRTCRAIRWRVLSPSSMWCGRRCWRWPAPRKQHLGSDAGARRLHLQKENRPPRICPGQLRKGEDGVLEAVKFPREGAGLLSSLVDTDGLVELGEADHAGRAGPDGRVFVLCEPDVTPPAMAVDDAGRPSPCSLA